MLNKPALHLALKVSNRSHSLRECGRLLDLPTSEAYDKGEVWRFGPPGRQKERIINRNLWEYRQILHDNFAEGFDNFMETVFVKRIAKYSDLPPDSECEFYYRYTRDEIQCPPSVQFDTTIIEIFNRLSIKIDMEFY